MIYGFVFESSEEQRFPHPLLQTSQQLREECKPILLPHLGLQITKGYYYDTNSPWILALVPRLNIKYCHERNYTWHAFCNNPYLLDLLATPSVPHQQDDDTQLQSRNAQPPCHFLLRLPCFKQL